MTMFYLATGHILPGNRLYFTWQQTIFYLATEPHSDDIFEGSQNDCSLMMYLKTEHVFENFGVGAIARLFSPWLQDLLARLSASLRNKSFKHLGLVQSDQQALLVFANFFSMKVIIQTRQ